MIQLLKADVSLHILRTDISRFFHSIDLDSLCDRITRDTILTRREIDSLNGIAEQTNHVQHNGLPWGLPISSTLAEIYLRDFDQHIKCIKGIYYYHRFVDDIIVFSTQTASEARQALVASLPNNLALHPLKTVEIDEPAKPPPQTEFTYLGFHFKRNPRSPALEIRIAPPKVARMKTRILRSFKYFHTNGDIHLLRKRLQFLTGNCSVIKSAHEAPIRTGIYYNYSLITHKESLIELTHFLRQQIIGARSQLQRTQRPIRRQHFNTLFKFCFLHGHDTRMMHRFSISELERLTAAWKYAT